MAKKLPGICFIGCGDIAARHAKMLKKIFPEIELSFASRDGLKAEALKKKVKGKGYYKSYEEAIRSDSFNIAFITTPHAFHSQLAVLAAENKKDIIIEKPAARTMEEFDQIEKSVLKNRVRCVIAENYFYKPFLKIIKEYLENGMIGTPLFIELNKTSRDKITGWRADAEMMGGGALLEGGVHWVNALVSIAGSDPEEVIAVKPGVDYSTNIPFEDSLMVCVKFKSGVVGKLLHSWRIPNPMKGMGISKIYGTDGVISFESNGLYVSLRGKKNKKSFILSPDFLGFRSMLREFVNSYIDEKEWEPSLERIKREMQLVRAAYKSLDSGRFEKII